MLALVARGKANKEIATLLFISENTGRTTSATSSRSCSSTPASRPLYAMRRNLIEPEA